jgi:leucyl aminopeptidase
MHIHFPPQKDKPYDTLLIPFPASISNEDFETLTPGLKGMSKPDAGSWHFLIHEGHQIILFAFDEKGNLGAVARQFRLVATKTSAHWKGNTSMTAAHLGDHLLAAITGLELTSYELGTMKTHLPSEKPSYDIDITDVALGKEDLIRQAKIRAIAQKRAMYLVDLPPNEKTPMFLGEWARNSASEYGYACEVLDHHHIETEGLNALHAVGKGSENPPVFIVCSYNGRPEDTTCDVALIGKGITFDTGGLSIKPSTNLHYMKSDMAGGAAMLGAIEVASQLKLEINITIIIPSAENAVDAKSLRPGDIIKSYSGKSIEIIDTDAEGRLILADGIAWTVKNLNPKVMIDMATLTGSSVRALGKEASALYSENESLLDLLKSCGQSTGEKLWPMPLWSDYDSYIHSDVADVSNLPLSPVAGSIAAAKFLQVFTGDHQSWAHIDMPGMSFGDSPFYKTKSATGFGVQLIAEVMIKMASNPNLITV